MRTIGKHWPDKAPRGDFQATCDYCGIQWRRSQLVRNRAGLLACPDDQSGKDEVTLAEGNALWASRPRAVSMIRDGGNFDDAAQEYLTQPPSIVSTNIAGWWQPSQASVGTSGLSLISNLVRGTAQSAPAHVGDVYQPDASLRPQESGQDVIYASDFLRSNSGPLMSVGASPCVWIVGSMDDVATGILALESSVPFVDLLSLSRAGSQIFPVASYSGSGITTFGVSGIDDGLHLFSVRMETTRLVLKVDDTEYTTPASGTLSANVVGLTMGGIAQGTLSLQGRNNEVVVTPAVPSADQIADLEAYFRKVYTELPQ